MKILIDIIFLIPFLQGLFYLLFYKSKINLKYHEQEKNKLYGLTSTVLGFAIGGFCILINHLFFLFNTRIGMFFVFIILIFIYQFIGVVMYVKLGLDEYDKQQLQKNIEDDKKEES